MQRARHHETRLSLACPFYLAPTSRRPLLFVDRRATRPTFPRHILLSYIHLSTLWLFQKVRIRSISRLLPSLPTILFDTCCHTTGYQKRKQLGKDTRSQEAQDSVTRRCRFTVDDQTSCHMVVPYLTSLSFLDGWVYIRYSFTSEIVNPFRRLHQSPCNHDTLWEFHDTTRTSFHSGSDYDLHHALSFIFHCSLFYRSRILYRHGLY